MKIKIYIIILFLSLINFGCKQKVTNVYEGTLIHRNDLPFTCAVDRSDIFLKTSINDSDFPDGVRYYIIFPKDGKYQDFQNNIGNKVSLDGIEAKSGLLPPRPVVPDNTLPDNTPEEEKPKPYRFEIYSLSDAEIIKVY